jgi:hypothetical protein
MEQRPSWKANLFAASQEIPRVLLNPKIHYFTLLYVHAKQISTYIICLITYFHSFLFAFDSWFISIETSTAISYAAGLTLWGVLTQYQAQNEADE